jgi:hypothetical protein
MYSYIHLCINVLYVIIYSFIHYLFMYLCIYIFITLFICFLNHLFTYVFIQSFIHLFIYVFMYLDINSFIDLFISSFMFLCIYLRIYVFMYFSACLCVYVCETADGTLGLKWAIVLITALFMMCLLRWVLTNYLPVYFWPSNPSYLFPDCFGKQGEPLESKWKKKKNCTQEYSCPTSHQPSDLGLELLCLSLPGRFFSHLYSFPSHSPTTEKKTWGEESCPVQFINLCQHHCHHHQWTWVQSSWSGLQWYQEDLSLGSPLRNTKLTVNVDCYSIKYMPNGNQIWAQSGELNLC